MVVFFNAKYFIDDPFQIKYSVSHFFPIKLPVAADWSAEVHLHVCRHFTPSHLYPPDGKRCGLSRVNQHEWSANHKT